MKIKNPLGFKKQHISIVLEQLAAQENCDGEPYDQMIEAAKYIRELEAKILELQEFAIWLTGCGYEFTQHEYFIKQRDKLLIQ